MTNRALLVVDMQNGFCHPDGSFSQIGMGTWWMSSAAGPRTWWWTRCASTT